MKLLLATQNLKKRKEMEDILNGHFEIITLKDLLDDTLLEETGDSFFENALLKACYFGKKYQMLTVADDSGLCVDALHGEPGIFSARYSGLGDQENNQLLLKNLEGITDRTAHFECSIVLFDPITCEYHHYKGALHGEILETPSGNNGFGYDPIFYLSEYKMSLASLHPDLKNKISHRAIALEALKEDLICKF